MNRCHFTRPPRAVRHATKDNLALVPGSLLPHKVVYQHIANALPRGAVLIVLPADSPIQKQAMLTVAKQLGKQGLQVSVLPEAELTRSRRR
jgi:hypothetical protein